MKDSKRFKRYKEKGKHYEDDARCQWSDIIISLTTNSPSRSPGHPQQGQMVHHRVACEEQKGGPQLATLRILRKIKEATLN